VTDERTSYGWDVGPSEFGPRGIISKPERSQMGNLVLRVGVENIDSTTGFRRSNGWHQVAHVVLTPGEAAELLALCEEVLDR
jgi:hypothetical protein